MYACSVYAIRMKSISMLPVGVRIRSELALRGLTGKDLAACLGLPPNSISRRLSGHTEFSASELARAAAWLGVPVGRFFEPIPNGSPQEGRSDER